MDTDPEANLAAVFGPLTWQQTATFKREASTTYRGHPIVLRRSAGDRHHVWSTTLRVPLQRPIEIHLNFRGPGRYLLSVPDIETGDPAFDERYRLAGWPPDIVRAALTADLRQRLLAADFYPGTTDGYFEAGISRHIEGARRGRNASGQAIKAWEGPGDPAQAKARIDLFFDVLESVQRGMDDTFREIETTQGREAAEAWWEEQRHPKGGGASRALLVPLILVPVLLLALALVFLAVL